MKNKYRALFFTAIIVAASGIFSSFNSLSGNGDWIKYTDKKKGKFEVLLPQKPKTNKDKF